MLTKKSLKIAFILILIGGIGMLFTYKSYFKGINISEDLEIENTSYENIDIDIRVSDLEIIEIEDEKEARIEIRGNSNTKSQPVFKVNVENGTLYVEEKDQEKKWVGFHIETGLNVKVYTKKKDYNKINVNSKVGDIKINNIGADTFYVEGELGSVKLGDITAPTVNVSSKVGNITLNNIKGETLEADSETGNITLDNVNSHLDLGSSVGNIKIYLDKIENDIKASSNLGSIKVTTKDEIDATLIANSNIGDINILDKYKGYAELGSGKYNIELNTEVGDIDVMQK